MKTRFWIFLVIAVLISGCASNPQQSVALSKEVASPQAGRIGVVMTALPKLDTYFPGADCLLCYATASAMNSKLTAHTKTLTYEGLPNLKEEVASLLRNKGADVVVINESINVSGLKSASQKGENVAPKDFTSLQQKYGVDRLLVIDISKLGFIRNYSAYIPVGAPSAQLRGLGYMVNLRSNKYEWYEEVWVLQGAEGNWDEPPKFPGLTNAYFQALEMGRNRLLKPFVSEQTTNRASNTPNNPVTVSN
ncbi:MAG: hypothetical protein AB1400_09815 [Pseudomonadota bacterium]